MSREIIEALHLIEREKGIAFPALVSALEDALLSAYKKTPGAVEHAKVEVDTETGDVRVLKMTCAVDAGRVIHPDNVVGQLQGGMDMGVGLALREEYVAGQTKDWVTFKYPSMQTAFDMDVIILETPRKYGANGSVGVGEMTLVPTAPAVLNAIEDAAGVRIHDLPATPDRVKAALAVATAR